jgi:oligoendopeptidase F
VIIRGQQRRPDAQEVAGMNERSAENDSVPTAWRAFGSRYAALLEGDLTPGQVPSWLRTWSELEKDVWEFRASLKRATDENTADQQALEAFLAFVREVTPRVQVAAQELKAKLLAVGDFRPEPDQEQMLSRLRNEVELFRTENVPLLTEIEALGNGFNTITGDIVVLLDGEVYTIPQVLPRLHSLERAERERAWRAIVAAKLEKAPELDALFLELLKLRHQLAVNAGLPNFRAYQWRAMNRFDYTPEDSLRLDDAIATEAVPLLGNVHERRREKLSVDSLRPWDREVDPDGREALRPFGTATELEDSLGPGLHAPRPGPWREVRAPA